MDSLIHKINLDCLRKDSQAIVNAKIGEASGRKIVFTLYEGRAPFFVPSDTTVVFRAKKPSGAVLYNNCVVDDGKIEYTITSQTVAEKGAFPCEIQIIGADNKVIYTPCITLNVTENLYSDTEVESSNEFTELENALNKIPSLEVINSKYTKPDGGIPKSDLAQDVQNSLSKANTALQEHQSLAAYRTAEAQDLIDSTKQDKLIAGENIIIADDGKTISAKCVGVLEVTLTTQNGVDVADKTFEQVKAAVDSGIPVLKVHSDGDLLWFFLLDKSPTEIDFVGIYDEQIIAYLTAKQDNTWETTVAARVTAEMLSSLNDKIGNLNDLTTEAKNNLVAAINEAAQSGGGGGSASIAMRVDGGFIQYSTDNGKTWVNLIAESDLKGDKGDKGADGAPGTKGDPGAPGKDGAPGIYYGTTQPTGDTHPVWIDPDGGPNDGGLLPAVTAADNGKVLRVASGAWSAADMPTGGTDMGITGANVGQISKITAVDDTGKPTAWEAVDMPTTLPNPNALTFTGAVTGSYDGSEPLTVEIPSGGGNKGWTLLYDGTITIEQAVKTVTDSLLVSCDGMVDFVGYIKWTANANTENANDNISISVGKANMGYGRVSDPSNAGNAVFQATVTSNRTYFGRAIAGVDLEVNTQNMQCGFSPNKQNPDYENVIINFFAKTYAGTITLQLYGR